MTLLLRAGANPSARDSHGSAPLHDAALYGAADRVVLLLEHGAEVDAPWGDPENLSAPAGQTPLMVACGAFLGLPVLGSPAECVRQLLAHGANPNARDGRGWTALMYFAVRNSIRSAGEAGCHPMEIAEALVRAGGDVSATSKDHLTALMIATREQNDRLVAFLRAHGATLSADQVANLYPGADHDERCETPRYDPDFAYTRDNVIVRLVGRAHLLEGVRAELAALLGVSVTDRAQDLGVLELRAKEGIDVPALDRRYQARGLMVISVTVGGLDPKRASEALVLPTRDPLDAVGWVQTNAANYGMSPQPIIEFLAELQAACPFAVVQVSHKEISGRLLGELPAAKRWAQRMLTICPDMDIDYDDDQAALKGVTERLKKHRTFYFFWE